VEDGLNSTPTLLVGESPIVGYVSMADLEPVIEKEISRALGTPVPTDEPAATSAPEE
jgi:hypothetical protein